MSKSNTGGVKGFIKQYNNQEDLEVAILSHCAGVEMFKKNSERTNPFDGLFDRLSVFKDSRGFLGARSPSALGTNQSVKGLVRRESFSHARLKHSRSIFFKHIFPSAFIQNTSFLKCGTGSTCYLSSAAEHVRTKDLFDREETRGSFSFPDQST
eukprot:1195037-Prorocentrum_minimum.AAC.3